MIVRLDFARTGAYSRPRASDVCAPPVHSDLLLAPYIYISITKGFAGLSAGLW